MPRNGYRKRLITRRKPLTNAEIEWLRTHLVSVLKDWPKREKKSNTDTEYCKAQGILTAYDIMEFGEWGGINEPVWNKRTYRINLTVFFDIVCQDIIKGIDVKNSIEIPKD